MAFKDNVSFTHFSGNMLTPGEILGNLSQIINDTQSQSEHPLGILTTQNRNIWAEQRAYLEATGNQDTLRKIDSGIFNLILDNEALHDDKHKLLKHYLHGDGLNRYCV